MRRRALGWAAGALAILLLLAAVPVALAALIDRGYLRGPLLHFLATRLDRPLRVDGAIEAHLLSPMPSLTAHDVTLDNPRWTPPGQTARIGRVALVLERWPVFGRELELHQLVIEDASLFLARDIEGRANWQASPPHTPSVRGGPPLIHSFSVQRTHLQLDDARRHLDFTGSVSAHDDIAARPAPLWHLEGAGRLNGHAASVALNADSLAEVRRGRPYRFAFEERSSNSVLDGRGEVPEPFDFRVLDIDATASGEDLKDLFFLVGVSLPDTGHYRAAVRIERNHSLFRYRDLSLSAGDSDLRGTLNIETRGGRARIDGELESRLLRTADIGAAAAGRAAARSATERALLLPDTLLPSDGMRAEDAEVTYRAHELRIGHMPLFAATAHISLEQAKLAIAPFEATLYQGRVSGSARLDAGREPAGASIDLKLADLRPAVIERAAKGPPPFDGAIEARIELKGQGRSLHQFAATADGTVSMVAPGGTLRSALADLIGANPVHGLGLLLSKDQSQTGVRCGVASFTAQHGVLRAQTLLLDTDTVLISGEGEIRLDSESFDITLHGEPKRRHLMRLHTPVLVGGTFEHPSIGIGGGSGAAQATKALAIGVVRTPLEILGFVDSELAGNADCNALLQAAQRRGVPP
jgi:hypothetical protein